MAKSRTPLILSFVTLLIIAVGAAFYLLSPSDAKKAPDSATASLVSKPPEPAATTQEQPEIIDPAPAQTAEQPGTTPSEAKREGWEARRAARFEAYSKLPAQERASRLSKQWGLSEQQEKDIAAIMARYSEELAALEQQNLSDAERAQAQQRMQRQQMQDIAPIVSESPGLHSAMQRFMAAAQARGGKLVTPQSQ